MTSDTPCLPYRIEYREGVGRMVVAVRDIMAGEVVLTDTALLSGPGSSTPPVCCDCLSPWTGDYVCSMCGWPVCGPECEAGENHRIECPVLARCPKDKRPNFEAAGNCPEYALIMPLRIALLEKESEHKDKLELLMDHKEDIVGDAKFEDKWNKPVIEYLTKTFESGITREEILRGIGIFCTNAAYMGHKNGRWLFPNFSFLSHSCVSNSRFFISTEGKVTVRAQTAIAEGEEITQSYFPTHKGNVLRRKTIKDLWYFTCTCARCEDRTELGTYLSSVHCRACKGGYLLQTDIANLTSDFDCDNCEASISYDTMISLIETLSSEMKNKDMELDQIKNMIENYQKILHPQHFLIMELKQRWVDKASEVNTETKDILENIITFINDICKVNSLIEPGLTITLGQNLKCLNTAMLSLAKIKVAAGEISKMEFMKVAMKAAKNIKTATDCFENTV